MEKIRKVLTVFAYVTTCVVLASAVYISIFWKDTQLSVDILWQILITSFLCSAGLFAVEDSKEVSGKRGLLKMVLYYIYVNIVVLTAGFLFEWFLADDAAMVLGMIIMIAFVFATVSLIEYYHDRKLADQMLQKLQERTKGRDL